MGAVRERAAIDTPFLGLHNKRGPKGEAGTGFANASKAHSKEHTGPIEHTGSKEHIGGEERASHKEHTTDGDGSIDVAIKGAGREVPRFSKAPTEAAGAKDVIATTNVMTTVAALPTASAGAAGKEVPRFSKATAAAILVTLKDAIDNSLAAPLVVEAAPAALISLRVLTT